MIPKRLQQIQRLEEAWWARWREDGFSLMCPRMRWHTQVRNVRRGDIVLVKYDQKLGKDKFRLARISEVVPDGHGRVRTVVADIRDKRKAVRERTEVCRAGLMQIRLPIQRLVVVLPYGEEWNQGLVHEEGTPNSS